MRVLALLLLVAFLAPPVWAEDEPKPVDPKPEEPKPETPATDTPAPAAPTPVTLPFGLEHMAPAAGALPEGWSAGNSPPPKAAPTEAALLALAKAAGIPEGAAKAQVTGLTKGEGEVATHGVTAWLTVDTTVDTFAPALKSAAEKNGWLLKSVAVPQRVLVTWADTKEAATGLQRWQVAQSVRNLCTQGWAMIEAANGGFDPQARQKAFQRGGLLIGAAGKTEPAAGIFNAMIGALLAQRDPAAALEHGRRALAKDAPVPAGDLWIAVTANSVGSVLLMKMDASVVAEARDALLRGVAAEKSATNPIMRFGMRYNLACAYARLDESDAAFKHLEESLRFLKHAWQEDKKKSFSGVSSLGYEQHYAHAKSIDTDMATLRTDARWPKLMATYDPSAKADEKPVEKPAKDEGGK